MGNDVIGNRYFILAQIPLFYLAYQKNKLYNKQKTNYLIILCVMPFIIITSFITLNAYALDPFISRKIKKTELGFEFMSSGIGGYEFVYFLVICATILLYVVFNKELQFTKRQKTFGLFLLLLISTNIIMSNYSIALYLLLLSFIVRVFIKSINKKSTLVFAIFAFFLLFISIQIFAATVLNWLIDLSGDSLYASRFIEIKQYIISNQMGDLLQDRFYYWRESVDVFLEYPIGGAVQSQLFYTNNRLFGFGQHSQILDTFALFGTGIGLLQFYVLLQPIYLRIKTKNNFYSGLSLMLFIQTIILLTLNNATPSIGFALFFIFPTVYDWQQKHSLVTQN